MVKTRKDLTGKVFSRLAVIRQVDDYIQPNGHHAARWLVACCCGSPAFIVKQGNLLSGNTSSCGCYQKEKAAATQFKHGKSNTSTHRSWTGMVQRCTNPRYDSYDWYGARGVIVCDRWLHSFENFLEDMGECPEGLSLDRIDVNGNYEPSNCRWATNSEQSYNQRKSRRNTSGRTGVSWRVKSCKWEAKIHKGGIPVCLGYFTSFEDAVAAREAAELEVYGYIKEKDGLTQPPPNVKVLPQTGEQTEDPIVKEENNEHRE